MATLNIIVFERDSEYKEIIYSGNHQFNKRSRERVRKFKINWIVCLID